MNFMKKADKNSVIGGTTFDNFGYEKLKRGVDNFEERLSIVNDMLKDNTYFEESMEISMDNYDLKKGYLQEDYEFANRILAMANYLLFSPDIERGAKLEYNIYEHESTSNAKHRKTASIEGFCENNAEPIMTPAKGNYKLDKKLTMSKIKRSEVIKKYPHIKDYFILLDYVNEQERGKNKIKKKDISDDILYIADLHSIKFKQPMSDGAPIFKIEEVEFNNAELIKILLKMPKRDIYDFNNDIEVLQYDFDELYKRTRVKDAHREIIEMLKLGYLENEVALKYNITQQRVNSIVKQVVESILKQNNNESIVN